ncbi:hypothetical protein KSF_088570 [Reticulibacter mediterranei]|uniref:Uncharacterized protein n=1 Tax=Reticulibacter mediterranei TaxID=2778369 RepID=A0A8J3IVV9_9CHLR|nr:hypothetical protein [Reticulibacter mediterranei]GHO98809.1 hypothetical protein KSF_088570 [Reticulibacter mediterranei]
MLDPGQRKAPVILLVLTGERELPEQCQQGQRGQISCLLTLNLVGKQAQQEPEPMDADSCYLVLMNFIRRFSC